MRKNAGLLVEMVLAQDEIDACREAFLAFDKDRYEAFVLLRLNDILVLILLVGTQERNH